MAMTSFDEMTAEIATAHDRLGHRLGWRFLYGPRRTLSPHARLAFVGLNPGGGVFEPPEPSVEEGNAYRVQQWRNQPGPTPLQVQIRKLYQRLSARMDGPRGWEQLMDETLAANACPFRSASWDTLAAKAESLRFSRELWLQLLALAQPRVIICLGEPTATLIGAAIEARGARRTEHVVEPVGWGSVSWKLTRYGAAAGDTTLIRIPHLSRFAIVGRDASNVAVSRIVDEVAHAIT